MLQLARSPQLCQNASTMRVHVGEVELRGALERYAERYSLLEVSADQGRLPGAKGLNRWRAVVPAQFTFSVAMPHGIGGLTAETVC